MAEPRAGVAAQRGYRMDPLVPGGWAGCHRSVDQPLGPGPALGTWPPGPGSPGRKLPSSSLSPAGGAQLCVPPNPPACHRQGYRHFFPVWTWGKNRDNKEQLAVKQLPFSLENSIIPSLSLSSPAPHPTTRLSISLCKCEVFSSLAFTIMKKNVKL